MSTCSEVCPANDRFLIVTGPHDPVAVQEERLRDAVHQGAAPRLHPGITQEVAPKQSQRAPKAARNRFSTGMDAAVTKPLFHAECS